MINSTGVVCDCSKCKGKQVSSIKLVSRDSKIIALLVRELLSGSEYIINSEIYKCSGWCGRR